MPYYKSLILFLKPYALSHKPWRKSAYILTLLFVILLASCTKESPYVIMLSMDGFRWDYASKVETPNIDRMVREGVHAESLIPSYPSKTFPNHYSMATGLYPDHHGIVQNNFFDKELNREFSIGNRSTVSDSIFWGGEPIWETAERQGVRAASFYWVGSETNAFYQPSRKKLYVEEVSFGSRIDSVISWLNLPEKNRPHLIMFYFHEPDGVGHQYGPDSDELKDYIIKLDHYLGDFLKKLDQTEKALGIEVNFILTSDHGMGAIAEDQMIVLSDIIDTERLIRVHGGNPVYLISPETNYLEEAYANLKSTTGLKVWKKAELPKHYHYGTNPRIEELIIEANSGWGLTIKPRRGYYSAGTHGYDPQNSDMHGIFYASGPAFKNGYEHPGFENVCLYPLIAAILKLEPAATDGKLQSVKSMLNPITE